jgi:hypothetical protein
MGWMGVWEMMIVEEVEGSMIVEEVEGLMIAGEARVLVPLESDFVYSAAEGLDDLNSIPA